MAVLSYGIKRSKKELGFIFFGSLLLCIYPLINKYPFVYSDTGSYIYSGFNNLLFEDRTIFYGLFLRHTSLHETLWFVVFTQSLILSFLIFVTSKNFLPERFAEKAYVLTMAFLGIFTGLPFTVGLITPDVFTPILLLCLVNVLCAKNLSRRRIIFLSILMIFSICSQISSLVTMTFIALIIFIYFLIAKVRRKTPVFNLKRLLLTFFLWLSSFFVIPSIHYLAGGRFFVTGAGHVFVMNHMLETGILEEYLEESCKTEAYTICNYKNNLGWDFVWSKDSPVYKTGGWAVNRQEYEYIIKDILSQPRYLVKLSLKAFEYTLKQFFCFDVAVPPPMLGGSPVLGQVSWRFEDSTREYLSSLQSLGKWDLGILNFVYRIIIFLSLTFLIVVFLLPGTVLFPSSELKLAIKLSVFYILINCFVCSNLSTVDYRFQARLIWILPLYSIFLLFANYDRIIGKLLKHR